MVLPLMKVEEEEEKRNFSKEEKVKKGETGRPSSIKLLKKILDKLSVKGSVRRLSPSLRSHTTAHIHTTTIEQPYSLAPFVTFRHSLWVSYST